MTINLSLRLLLLLLVNVLSSLLLFEKHSGLNEMRLLHTINNNNNNNIVFYYTLPTMAIYNNTLPRRQ